MEMPKPQKEHAWLHKMVGEWVAEGEGVMEPDQPPMKWTGTESVRSLGGLWVLAEGRGADPEDETATTLMTLGYDPQKQRFVGTFIGAMMTNLWVYEGVLDADERLLTLDTEGPTAEGKMAKFQDIVEFVSDDHRILSSRLLGEDGQWRQVMTTHYRRKT